MGLSSAARRRLVWVIAAGVLGYLLAQATVALRQSMVGGTELDYLALASAGRLVHAGSHCLYCTTDLARAQSQLLGSPVPIGGRFPLAFANPPLAAWLIQPLAMLPLQTGADIFVVLNVVSMAAAAILLTVLMRPAVALAPAVTIAVAAVFSLAGDAVILLGQSDGLMLLCATAALWVLQRGHSCAAGLLLGPLWLKPQLIWLLPVILAVTREWRMFISVISAGVAVVATSAMILGRDQLLDMAGALASQGYQHLDLQSTSIPALIARPSGSHLAVWITAAIGATLATAVIWHVRRRLHAHRVEALAVGIALSVTLSPHLGDYSLVLLALPVAVLARRTLGLALTLIVAFTLVTAVNPPQGWSESGVAAVELVGLIASLLRLARVPTPAWWLGRRPAAASG